MPLSYAVLYLAEKIDWNECSASPLRESAIEVIGAAKESAKNDIDRDACARALEILKP